MSAPQHKFINRVMRIATPWRKQRQERTPALEEQVATLNETVEQLRADLEWFQYDIEPRLDVLAEWLADVAAGEGS